MKALIFLVIFAVLFNNAFGSLRLSQGEVAAAKDDCPTGEALCEGQICCREGACCYLDATKTAYCCEYLSV